MRNLRYKSAYNLYFRKWANEKKTKIKRKTKNK